MKTQEQKDKAVIKIWIRKYLMSADGIFSLATWVGVIALGIGVVCAFAIAISGKIRDDRLTLALSDANVHIKELDLEIAKLNAPRQISGEDEERILAVIKPLGGFPYDLSIPTLLEPGSGLIGQLVWILRRAGWGLRPIQGNVPTEPIDSSLSRTTAGFSVLPIENDPPGSPPQALPIPPILLGRNSDVVGIKILFDPFGPSGHPKLADPAFALMRTLKDAGIATQAFAWETKNNMARDVIHVIVGAKP